MNMTVWNPMREMERLFERYNRGDHRGIDFSDSESSFSQWSPTVDIEEDDNHYLVRADIPGVDKKDINVQLENGVLSISGEKKEETETGKGSKQHRTERFYGSFSRRFSLPTAIKPDEVSASYKDGVLSLKIPKAEEVKPKAIEIKVK